MYLKNSNAYRNPKHKVIIGTKTTRESLVSICSLWQKFFFWSLFFIQETSKLRCCFGHCPLLLNFWFQGLIKLVSSNVILHWDAVKKDSLAVSQISASFVCGRGHCGVVSNLLSCHLLCLPPPRLPLILPARVEPVSRSACDHGAVPRLSGQAANDIMFYCGCVCLWGGGSRKWHLWSLWHTICLTHQVHTLSQI